MRKEVTRYSMEFVKNIVTDSNTIEILLDYLPDRVFVYNKTNKTIYEKIDDEFCPLGSEESYTKGKNALHYEGELSKVSDLDSSALDGSVYLIENDTTTYENRIVNSLFIKLPNNIWKEVRLNVYSTGEVDKMMNDEKTAREEADTILQENIDAEAQARESADITLQENIDEEARIRESADTTLQENIDNEAQAREAADVILQENIDNEAKTREDADNALQENINLEAQTRESADIALQENIDTEAQTRESADTTLQENIDAINKLLSDNIDFENNKVVQYAGAIEKLPENLENYKIGTCWKITGEFSLNGETYPKNTFVIKKDETGLDILGGGQTKNAVFESERVIVRSVDDTVWVTNYFMGKTTEKGKYIIFNNYSSDAQTYSYGHFLIKGSLNVYSFDVLLNQSNGVLNNYWSQGNGAPVEVYSCKYGNKNYIALFINSTQDFEVFYTGWISSDFETFDYKQNQLSDFSPVALGELDVNNLPKGSSVSYEPTFKYSVNSKQRITEYWDNWDWEKYPVAYVKPVMNNNNARSIDFRWTFGDGITGDTANWYQENLNALKHILGDPNKPTYLILDNMIHLNQLTVERIGLFLGGVSNDFPGLKGLYMPQDEDSNYSGADWWGTDTNRLFLVNFTNLEYLKMNPYIKKFGTFCLRDLISLKSIVMPRDLETLDFNDDRPLYNCKNLTQIVLPSEDRVIEISGTYGDGAADFFWRDGSEILVKRSLLKSYKERYYLDGYILALIRGF